MTAAPPVPWAVVLAAGEGKRMRSGRAKDVPLLGAATLTRLLARHRQTRAAATVLTFRPADPTGYGRIVRRDGRVRAIVEERDATAAERRIRECNSGVYVFDPRRLWPALDRLAPDNDQGEYYLTDVASLLARQGRRVEP